MTTLTQVRLPIPAADMNGESTLPRLYDATLPKDPQQTLLDEDDGLEIPDIKEGEISITELWFSIAEKKAARDGLPFDKATAKPPKKFDFRMNVAD